MIGQNVGKYRILDKLGRGGMGTVYRAVDETLNRDVAIKVLNAELNDPEVARRFRAEAVTVARLSHPGIAGIYELFEHEGEWLMVMEFVRGETLENMVNRMGPLSAQRAAELCMQALAALAHAHSMGVVHRDLKPANLMVTESGSVKVMDFGIARVSGSEHLTNAGFMMGTPAYMAPEQVRGGEIDARADIYALGVVFYRLTTAKLPFKGETAFAMVQSQVNDPPTPVGLVRSDLPPWVEAVISRALAKAPEHRFQSAAEFHEAFARCLAGLPLSSMYAGAPGEVLMTPPRAIPTGAFQARPPMSTSQFQTGTGAYPTMAAPGTNPGMIAGANDPTLMATPARTPAFNGSTVAQPPGSPAAPASASEVPAAAASAKKSSNVGALAGIGAIVVIGAIAAVVMFRGGSNAPQQTAPEATTTAVAPPPVPEPPSAAVVSQPPMGAGQPAGVAATPPAGPATVGAPSKAAAASPSGAKPLTSSPGSPGGPLTASKSATSGPATSGATGSTGGGNDPLVTFPDVKLFTVTSGKKTTDQDALLNFSGGQLLVMPKRGGTAMATVPYKRITRATYVRARDPKWDPTLSAPPEGVDVGSFIRSGRHWLVLQGPDHYEILRLEDSNFERILDTFESRTGIKIDRPKGDERQAGSLVRTSDPENLRTRRTRS